MNCGLVLLAMSTIGAIYVGFLMRRPVSLLCDSSRCPYCYGTGLCEDVFNERITLRYDSVADLLNNLVGTKNVFFAHHSGRKVVLKKLGNREELDRVQPLYPVSTDHITEYWDRGPSLGGKSCDPNTTKLLLERLEQHFSLEQLWTLVQINVEPLILTLYPNERHWPVPRLHGACGLVVVEQHCGRPLNDFRTFDWGRRAYLALQSLEAAVDFTLRHADFGLYLTDVSPDNIAVDDDFRLYFVDVENVIVKRRRAGDDDGTTSTTVHYSRHFDEEEFVYSEDEVCEHDVSDHNIYAVCKLLLSERAPWPMMSGGLLHSPPTAVAGGPLFDLVEECVQGNIDRFQTAQGLIELLNEVI